MGGGLTLHGRNAGSAKAAQLVPSSRVFLGWREPDPTTSAPLPVQPPVRTPVSRSAAPRRSGSTGDAWDCIRQHESGGNYSDPNGGAYQFLDSTWRSMGTGYPTAESAPPTVQDDAARRLQARSGWGQWTTASRCGLR